MLKRSFQRIVFYISMALFGLFALGTNTFFWLLNFLPGMSRRRRFARRWIHRMMRLWLWYLDWARVVVVTRPDWERMKALKGVVLIANHPNLLDICWILAASPDVTCYIKSAIRRNGFFNASASAAGYIANDSGIDGLRLAMERVRAGGVLCVFPEGTRTERPPLNDLRPGFALVAQKAHAPIQILFIRSNTRCFTKGIFFRPDTLPIRYDLALGPVYENDAERTAREMSAKIEFDMRRELSTERILRHVDPTLPVFRGHFPGKPLVPGAMLLDWMLSALPGGEDGAWTVKNAKFSRPIVPGEEIEISTTGDGTDFRATITSAAGEHARAAFHRDS